MRQAVAETDRVCGSCGSRTPPELHACWCLLLPFSTALGREGAARVTTSKRTYVVQLIDQSSLPAHLVGTHRRLNAADVPAFKRRQETTDGLQEITKADEELGLRY